METDRLVTLRKARANLLWRRDELAESLAGPEGQGELETFAKEFVEIQRAITAVDEALRDEAQNAKREIYLKNM
jgi:hypothetical protein